MSVFLMQLAKADHIAQATAATDESFEVGENQFDSTVTEVSIIPNAALTADATNNRTFTLQNRAQDGTGTVTVATLVTDVAGGNWAAHDEKLMTLTATVANRNLNAGDVLTMTETHGGTGVAHPEMQVVVRGTKR
jgi:hypothetical protein